MLEQKKKLTETQQGESSILNEIENVNARLARIETDLDKFRKNLRRTEKDIAAVNTEIARTRVKLQTEKEWLKRKLRMMNRLGYSGDVVLLLLTGEMCPR